MKRFLVLFTLFVMAAAGIAVSTGLVTAQQDSEGERSAFISYVENQISTPSMQIRLNGLSGALSSNVQLDSITLADKKGVWLTIEKPALVWSRAALLTGRVEVDSLTADKVEWTRMPEKDTSAPSPEASSFSLPSLPVSINLNQLDIKSVNFGQEVFGLQSVASISGRMKLEDGALDASLDVTRLDGPGGALKLAASYANETRNLNLDLSLSEPENGILANLLDIPGRPPVALSLKGDAPIDNLDVALEFDAGGSRVLDGQLNLRGQDAGMALRADLHGPLGTIMTAKYQPLFGSNTQLRADALLPDSGGVKINSLEVESGAIGISAKAETLADGFLAKLDLNAGIHPPQGASVLLPFGADGTSVGKADATISFDVQANERWTASLSVDNLSGKDSSIASIRLDTAGTASDIADASRRAITFNTNGHVGGIVLADPAMTKTLKDGILLNASGRWQAGDPVTVDKLAVSGSGLDFGFTGEIAGLAANGGYELAARDLSALSALTGQSLAGAIKIAANGKVEFLTQAFDLAIDGTAENLKTGDKRIDGLTGGKAVLAGHVSRSPDGLAFNAFKLESTAATISIDGMLASKEANLNASAKIGDLAAIDKRAGGVADLAASVQGTQGTFTINSSVSIRKGSLLGKPLSNASIAFDGRQTDGAISGKLTGKGNYAGDIISLAADLASANGTFSLGNMDGRFGPTLIKGGLSTREDGLITSDITVSSKNIRSAAAFALVEASGAVDAHIVLEPKPDGTQSATATATVRNLVADGNKVGSGSLKADAKDIFGALLVDAQFDGKDISAGGVDVAQASATAQTMGARTTFNANAHLKNDSRLATSGTAVRKGELTDLTLDKLDLSSAIANARLIRPARISLQNGVTRVSSFDLEVGNGRISAEGSAGKVLDFKAVFKNLPLNAANAVKPDLGLAGSLSGSATVSGDPTDPQAEFEIDGTGISASQLAQYDVSVIDVKARGSFKSGTVRIERATAGNSQGVAITAKGTIPLSGPGIDFDAEGSGPLGLAEPLLRTRGTSLSGTATFNAHLAGSLSQPNATGQISIANGSVEDPLSNLRLENVTLAASLRGDTVSIDNLSATVGKGGSITASGTVGLGDGMPADISVKLERASYTDGRTVSAKANGDLRLTGSLAYDPLLSGTVTLIEVEITIPESIASGGTLLEVKHVNTPERVQKTLDRLAAANPAPKPEARPSVLQLDITVNAPNRLFVRGRGIDAELGGSVRLTGPSTNIQPVGAFRLIRGRINIVGRRIVFSEGSVQLAGSLDPTIDFTASTTADDIEAQIRLTGRASNPKVTFTSQPELPQDEVLAYIIFGKSLTNLSPGQIARLASIAAELAGGGGGSLLNNLRAGTGLDELDVVSDKNGSAAVRAGRYVSDKVYLGVQAGSKETEATINLDITDNLTARGAANSKGDSSLGLFFEKDY